MITIATAQASLKPRGGPKVKFVITTIEPGREYTDVTLLLGAKLTFQHLATATATGSDLAVSITMSGPLGWLWSRILGGNFKKTAQTDLDTLVQLAEAG